MAVVCVGDDRKSCEARAQVVAIEPELFQRRCSCSSCLSGTLDRHCCAANCPEKLALAFAHREFLAEAQAWLSEPPVGCFE